MTGERAEIRRGYSARQQPLRDQCPAGRVLGAIFLVSFARSGIPFSLWLASRALFRPSYRFHIRARARRTNCPQPRAEENENVATRRESARPEPEQTVDSALI